MSRGKITQKISNNSKKKKLKFSHNFPFEVKKIIAVNKKTKNIKIVDLKNHTERITAKDTIYLIMVMMMKMLVAIKITIFYKNLLTIP